MANQVTNIAGVISAVTTTLAYTDSTAVTIATIPANSQITNIHIDTTTAFNAGTTNTVTVGKTGSAATFVASTSVTSLGRQSIATTGVYSAWADTGSSDISATITFTQTGTAATTGALRVTIMYKSYTI
jgi:hypothetical protein